MSLMIAIPERLGRPVSASHETENSARWRYCNAVSSFAEDGWRASRRSDLGRVPRSVAGPVGICRMIEEKEDGRPMIARTVRARDDSGTWYTCGPGLVLASRTKIGMYEMSAVMPCTCVSASVRRN